MPGTTAAATISDVKTATRATDCASTPRAADCASTPRAAGRASTPRAAGRMPADTALSVRRSRVVVGASWAAVRSMVLSVTGRTLPGHRADPGHYGAGMLAAYAASQSASDPLSGLVVGERPDPQTRPGWTVVDLRAAALNHHDVWSLRGV